MLNLKTTLETRWGKLLDFPYLSVRQRQLAQKEGSWGHFPKRSGIITVV